MTDPKVRPPTRITVSSGRKVEPHLYQRQPYRVVGRTHPLIRAAVVLVPIIIVLLIVLLYDGGIR